MSLFPQRYARFLAACLALGSATTDAAQSQPAAATPESIRARIKARFEADQLPSLQAAIVVGDDIVLHETLGWADRDENVPAKPDTLYCIGSITKTFTATLLVQLRDQGVVRLDDAAKKYLAANVRLPSDPRGAPEITLRHLATHTSGLPRLPNNLRGGASDPYNGYPLEAMYETLEKIALDGPIGEKVRYSNLAYGLLGHVLERAAGTPFPELLEQKLLRPLGMRSTRLKRDGEPEKSLATGYLGNSPEVVTPHWNLGSLAPAGAIVSNVPDLARYLSLQFRAGQANVTPVSGGSLVELHAPQRVLDGWRRGVALGWFVEPDDGAGDRVGHNGATFGFTSNMMFVPRAKIGVIVLTNCGKPLDDLAAALLRDALRAYGPPPAADRLDPRLGDVAARLADQISESPPDQIADLFSPAFLKQINLAAIKAVLGKLAREQGRCLGVGELRPTRRPGEAEGVLRFENGDVRFLIGIDDADPPRITTLFFPPGQ